MGVSASLFTNTISVFHVLSSMPTSELSDALNPNVVRQRNYDNVLGYQDQHVNPNPHHPNLRYEQPEQQPQYEYAPHRSELELAVVEPTPALRSAPALAHLRCSDGFIGHDPPPPTMRGSYYDYGKSPTKRKRAGDSPGRRNTRPGLLGSRTRTKEGYELCNKRSIHSRGTSGT